MFLGHVFFGRSVGIVSGTREDTERDEISFELIQGQLIKYVLWLTQHITLFGFMSESTSQDYYY